jgi:hypothetical protein
MSSIASSALILLASQTPHTAAAVHTMSAVLYFPPKEFSPRFGSQFFTVTLQGYELVGHPSACGGQYAVYNLQISRGRETWSVQKRFSEFDQLNQSLAQDLDKAIAIPLLPPKTCFPTIDQVGLSRDIHSTSDSFSVIP